MNISASILDEIPKQRRKLSIDSLVVQFSELETLKKTFDLFYYSKGEVFIHNEFSQLKSQLDLNYISKLSNLNKDNSIQDQTKTNLIACLDQNKSQLLELLNAKKKFLSHNLNNLKTNIDQTFENILLEYSKLDLSRNTSNEHNTQIRDQVLELKTKMKNSIEHFSHLNDFRLTIYDSLDPIKIADLDIYPDKMFSSQDIFQRVSKLNLKNVSFNNFENLNLIPFANFNFLAWDKNYSQIFLINPQGIIRFSLDLNKISDLKDIHSIQFKFNQDNIFLLIQNNSFYLYLMILDYKLKVIKYIKLKKQTHSEESLGLSLVDSELYVLRNNLDSNQVYFEVYDDNLNLIQELCPNTFKIDNNLNDSSDLPEVIGSFKEIIYVSLNIKENNEFKRTIRLINKDSGLEISKLENSVFNSCKNLFVTNENDPKIIGIDSLECNFYLFNINNGSQIKKCKLNLEESLDLNKIYFTPDGYFGLLCKDKCIYF